MKKLLFLLLLLTVVLFSCSIQKEGCKPEKRRKEIKFKGFMSMNDSPRNVQAKVFEISYLDNKRFEGRALSMGGDTIWVKRGFAGWSKQNVRLIKIGTWLTFFSDYNDKYQEWTCVRININQL